MKRLRALVMLVSAGLIAAGFGVLQVSSAPSAKATPAGFVLVGSGSTTDGQRKTWSFQIADQPPLRQPGCGGEEGTLRIEYSVKGDHGQGEWTSLWARVNGLEAWPNGDLFKNKWAFGTGAIEYPLCSSTVTIGMGGCLQAVLQSYRCWYPVPHSFYGPGEFKLYFKRAAPPPPTTTTTVPKPTTTVPKPTTTVPKPDVSSCALPMLVQNWHLKNKCNVKSNQKSQYVGTTTWTVDMTAAEARSVRQFLLGRALGAEGVAWVCKGIQRMPHKVVATIAWVCEWTAQLAKWLLGGASYVVWSQCERTGCTVMFSTYIPNSTIDLIAGNGNFLSLVAVPRVTVTPK